MALIDGDTHIRQCETCSHTFLTRTNVWQCNTCRGIQPTEQHKSVHIPQEADVFEKLIILQNQNDALQKVTNRLLKTIFFLILLIVIGLIVLFFNTGE